MHPLRALSPEDRLALLRLARTEHVGPISFFHLLNRYGSAQEALARLPDITRRTSPRIPSWDEVKREVEAHEQKGFLLVSYYDAFYPAALRALKDAPPFITLWGQPALLNKTLFAMVGSRHASLAGERLACQLSQHLGEQGWVLVSGLARGIDACVHRTCLTTGTIAVVAGGMGHVYPPEHKKLYEEIGEKGLVISEDPLGQPPCAPLFLKRNRLISGLSWGVLVVEASDKSGALMTAKYAGDQGRTVFAVPGHPLDFRARGCNKLLKQGAGLVETAEDILSEYGLFTHKMAEEPVQGYEAFCAYDEEVYGRLLSALSTVPISIDALGHSLQLPPMKIRAALIEMELNGEIQWHPGDEVVRLFHPTQAAAGL